jgi:hypothetical protein
VKINRVAMVKAVSDAIERENVAIERAKEQASAERQRRVDEWLEKNREPWTTAIKMIQKRFRAGEPVRQEDIPYDRTSRSNGNAIWHERSTSVLIPQRDQSLPGLLTLLEAIADDTVTTSSLRDLGVTPRTLQSIVPLLGAHTATANRKAVV